MVNKKKSLKIIGGQHKGRILEFEPTKDLRPTSHKARETLFNWLLRDIENSICLDLFAGTGALGIEALSRKAKSGTFLEKDKNNFLKLKKNVATLHLEAKSRVEMVNSLSWLKKQENILDFDILFIDPPFGYGLINKIYLILAEQKLIKNGALIYIEAEKNINLKEICHDWKEIKNKTSSQTTYSLFVK